MLSWFAQVFMGKAERGLSGFQALPLFLAVPSVHFPSSLRFRVDVQETLIHRQMFFQVCHLPVTVLVTYLGCPAHFQDFKYIPLFRCIFCFLFDSFGGSTRARSEVGLTWLGLFCD